MNPYLPSLGSDIPKDEETSNGKRLIDFSPLELPLKKPTTNYTHGDPHEFNQIYANLYGDITVDINHDAILEEAKQKMKEEYMQDMNDNTLTNSQVYEIINKMDEEEKQHEEGVYTRDEEHEQISFEDHMEDMYNNDNDYLIQFIKDIKNTQTKVNQIQIDLPKEKIYDEYIQIILDVMFYGLLKKYHLILTEPLRYSDIEYKPEILEFFKQEYSSNTLVEKIRNFKTEFKEQLLEIYYDINSRIGEPGMNEQVLIGRGITNPTTETTNKFLKYYTDTEETRSVKVKNFTNELINAIVFQYIFGYPVLGLSFDSDLERLKEEQSETEYPFIMKNKFLFGWAGTEMFGLPFGYNLENIKKIPTIIDKLYQYKEKVAKNAVLCIIRCQFSEWTMKTQDESMKFQIDTTQSMITNYKTIYEQYKLQFPEEKLAEKMNLELNEIEKEDPDFKQEQIDAFMQVVKGGEIPNDYKYYDYEAKKKIDIFKPLPNNTIRMLQRNYEKKIKNIFMNKKLREEIFQINGKSPIKKNKEIDLSKD